MYFIRRRLSTEALIKALGSVGMAGYLEEYDFKPLNSSIKMKEWIKQREVCLLKMEILPFISCLSEKQ